MRKGATDRLTTVDLKENVANCRKISLTVYERLRRIAAAYVRGEQPGQTLQATGLVHEAYLRLARTPANRRGDAEFVGFAAHTMREILVDRARARGAQKRWGGLERVSLTNAFAAAADPGSMLPALDEAIERLGVTDPDLARLVELRFFAGLTNEEAAQALGVSPATVKRRWNLARAWLFRELTDGAV